MLGDPVPRVMLVPCGTLLGHGGPGGTGQHVPAAPQDWLPQDLVPCPLLECPRPGPAACLSFPSHSHTRRFQSGGTPKHPGGFDPHWPPWLPPWRCLRSPDMGAWHSSGCFTVPRARPQAEALSTGVPVGSPRWVPGPGSLAPAPSGGGGLALRLDRKTNEFHYGIAILFHVSGSLRLTCSPGCDKPRHPRARARALGLRTLAGNGAA